MAPLLRRVGAQFNVKGLFRVGDETGADADQAPIEWRLALALHVNAEPELLREPLFKRGWRWGVVLHLVQPTASARYGSPYSLRTMMCFATV